jgi:hypothetical protein
MKKAVLKGYKYPHGSTLSLVSWFRIQESKNGPQNFKQAKKILSAGCSLLRAEGFSCCLDFLYGGYG